MSGKKTTDIKGTEMDSGALDMDSGFQSGPIDKIFDEDDDDAQALTCEEILKPKLEEAKPPRSDDKKVTVNVDSGVLTDDISLISNIISDIQLEDQILLKPPSVPLPSKDLPVDLLFQQDDDGDTQLHIAAVHGYEKPISTLIQVCPKKELLNLCNDYGETALHLAVMSRNAIVTRMLVIAGADIGIRDRRGETPLHKATALCHVQCMQALLQPVIGQQRKISTVLNQKNYNGQACVHVAATLGHIPSLQTLLFYGADINSRENKAGWTALHIAASRGPSALVQQLQGCRLLRARARDYAGRTPRRLARDPPLAALFQRHEDSDSDSDTDDDLFDEEAERLFEKFSNPNQTLVA